MPPKRPKARSVRPPQHQRRPGHEAALRPTPKSEAPSPDIGGSLRGKRALITGGDSGIGRAVAIAFAQHGADVAIAYLSEEEDARTTQTEVEAEGRRCVRIRADLTSPAACRRTVERSVRALGGLDIVVNNAATQFPEERFEDITRAHLELTFRTNVFAAFHLTQAALPHLRSGSTILNTTSVTAYRGSAHLIDYAATKGALVSFTRSLASALIGRGIRVNAVAPGPIWTPLIASTFTRKQVARFGSDAPIGRAGQPHEVASCFVFLASDAASYITGQVLHPNGGEIVNG